jgi:uncharacterized protein YlzI (FlbEa/FlbD family)
MYYPTYFLDKFFEEPHKIKELGLSCKYDFSDRNYPGGRTAALHTFNDELNNYVQNRIMSLIYGSETTKSDESFRWWASSFFQLIRPKDVKSADGSILNKGWIHVDQTPLTAIIYLTDHENTGGTSLYRIKGKEYFDNKTAIEEAKISKDFNITKQNDEKYDEYLEKNRSYYEEIALFKNKFNSILAFDGSNPHKADLNVTDNTYRLTLITFFYKVYAPYHPVNELRRTV